MPLILTELFVIFSRPLTWLARFLPSIALYLGALDLGREGKQYRTPIYMLILCLSLGVFYASLAKSADSWLLDRRQYEVGSDLLYSPRGTSIVAGQFSKVKEEPDFYQVASSIPASEYEQVKGVEAATPVGEYEASVAIPGEFSFVRLLAIDRLSFPRVTYYRPDYARESLGALMNRLGASRDGILIPRELADRLLLGERDRIQLNVLVDRETRHTFEFTVMGTFDYFPTMFPKEALVFVANLEYMQSQTAGVLPHSVWIRTTHDADGEEVAQEVIHHTHVIPEQTVTLGTILARDRARLERIGIFGVLSMCYVAGTLLSGFILLVHSTASMRRRALRFAVLQAMGLTRGKVMGTILIEYLGVLAYSMAAGVALGIASAYLYVPFFPLSDVAELPVPPFIPLIDRGGALIIAGAMAAILVLAEAAAIVRLMRSKIFGVLRMGTRE
jgi:putative ABC transport system permease protein